MYSFLLKCSIWPLFPALWRANLHSGRSLAIQQVIICCAYFNSYLFEINLGIIILFYFIPVFLLSAVETKGKNLENFSQNYVAV
jgi:hypothetical protein